MRLQHPLPRVDGACGVKAHSVMANRNVIVVALLLLPQMRLRLPLYLLAPVVLSYRRKNYQEP
jgi:hypothetical protein